MAHWLDEYPALRVMQKRIAAEDYNRIRVGLLRQHLPWYVPVEQFRCVLGILDDTAWICVDECRNNLPILAWTNFNTAHRAALDAPIDCELRLYHMHAGLLMGTALEALAQTVCGHNKQQVSDRYPVTELKR